MMRGTSTGGERRRFPGRHLIALVAAVLAGGPALAQTAPTLPADQAALVEAVQKAAVRAMNFTQGDLGSLRGAQNGFTPEGWRAFMKRLEGFVDDRGAPRFSSEFIPSGPPVILGQGNGTLHLSIPGTLTHRQNQSSTVYRSAALDVDARGMPLRIERLDQTVCVGLPPGASCR
jgi:hypothetical protein